MSRNSIGTSKNLGYVLGRMYPGSFSSYRGTIFRVTDNTRGAMSGIVSDARETRHLLKKLSTPSGSLLLEKIVKNIKKEIKADSGRKIRLKPENLNVFVPGKVNLRFDDTLRIIYCIKCGTLDSLRWAKFYWTEGMPKCKKCGSQTAQAPIFLPIRRDDADSTKVLMGTRSKDAAIQTIRESDLFCPNRTRDHKCKVTGKQCEIQDAIRQLKITDPQRQISSLRMVKENCPAGIPIEQEKLHRPWRTSEYFYVTDFPRESMTKSLRVSAIQSYELPNDDEILDVNNSLNTVKQLKLNREIVEMSQTKFSRLLVLEAVYGFKLASTSRGLSTYYLSGRENELPGRLIETQGFMLSLNTNFYRKLEEIRDQKYPNQEVKDLVYIALHSIKHCFLVLMPQFTGFEPTKFYGGYEFDEEAKESKVYVYDSDQGGSGGFAALMRDGEGFLDMMDQIKERITCPQKECDYACKLCLYTQSCGKTNQDLNRHLIIALNLFYD